MREICLQSLILMLLLGVEFEKRGSWDLQTNSSVSNSTINDNESELYNSVMLFINLKFFDSNMLC